MAKKWVNFSDFLSGSGKIFKEDFRLFIICAIERFNKKGNLYKKLIPTPPKS